MAAEVESMFYVRNKPWHNLGVCVSDAPASSEALELAGLNWMVEQKDVFTSDYKYVPGYKANVRNKDGVTLGIVTDRYKVVQNEDAFKFTDELLGEGVRYETAGSLQNGKRVWLLAKMPDKYVIAGDKIDPYFLIMNSHDGSCGIKACMTPVRVVCNNTLNLALNNAKRIWTTKHTENIMSRMTEAQETLFMAENYMSALGRKVDDLIKIRLTDAKVLEYMSDMFPVTEDMSDSQKKNNLRLLSDLKKRYFDAPDLKCIGKNAYRFINAVSDFATHAEPIRRTKNYAENLFLKTIEGNPLIDKAYMQVCAAA
ncbi:MAG: DUF945 domain-containing protein [Lachnospiraceae bacterium]|nr:DUF945 domain-containing protein [Lachnospiraceae bacterium]